MIQNEIVRSIARTLLVTTYAQLCDESEDPKLMRAGPGEDWMEVAPETTREAEDFAWRLCGKFEQANGMNIYCLAAKAWYADYPDSGDQRVKGYDDKFGHYITMMALGEGVSWFDDHVEFDLKVPSIDCTFDDAGFEWPEETTKE